MTKVFCQSCKHFGSWFNCCFATEKRENTWLSPNTKIVVSEKPWVLNANNDCPHYERQKCWRLFR